MADGIFVGEMLLHITAAAAAFCWNKKVIWYGATMNKNNKLSPLDSYAAIVYIILYKYIAYNVHRYMCLGKIQASMNEYGSCVPTEH